MVFLAGAAAAAPAYAAPADSDTLAMVEAFLKKPTADLPPEHIGRFMAVDAESLPEKLRKPFAAKKLELNTLRAIGAGKKRGFVRMPEDDCAAPSETLEKDPGILSMAGYEEIFDNEVLHLMQKTQCTERDLMCEFSLRVVSARDPKKKARPRYFLHGNDPLMALVAAYRGRSGAGGNTPFFGKGTFVCTPHTKRGS